MPNPETKTDLAVEAGTTHVKVLNLVAVCSGSIPPTGWVSLFGVCYRNTFQSQ